MNRIRARRCPGAGLETRARTTWSGPAGAGQGRGHVSNYLFRSGTQLSASFFAAGIFARRGRHSRAWSGEVRGSTGPTVHRPERLNLGALVAVGRWGAGAGPAAGRLGWRLANAGPIAPGAGYRLAGGVTLNRGIRGNRGSASLRKAFGPSPAGGPGGDLGQSAGPGGGSAFPPASPCLGWQQVHVGPGSPPVSPAPPAKRQPAGPVRSVFARASCAYRAAVA
jgi:hypothetical protein